MSGGLEHEGTCWGSMALSENALCLSGRTLLWKEIIGNSRGPVTRGKNVATTPAMTPTRMKSAMFCCSSYRRTRDVRAARQDSQRHQARVWSPQVVPFDKLKDRCGWKYIDIDYLSLVTVVKSFTIGSLTSAKTYGNSVFTMVNRGFVLCGFYCSLCIS